MRPSLSKAGLKSNPLFIGKLKFSKAPLDYDKPLPLHRKSFMKNIYFFGDVQDF